MSHHHTPRYAVEGIDWVEALGQAAAVVVSAAAWGWIAWRLFGA